MNMWVYSIPDSTSLAVTMVQQSVGRTAAGALANTQREATPDSPVWFAVEEDASTVLPKKSYLQMHKRQAADTSAFGDSGDGHCLHFLFFAPRFFSGAARRALDAFRLLETLQGRHCVVA